MTRSHPKQLAKPEMKERIEARIIYGIRKDDVAVVYKGQNKQ